MPAGVFNLVNGDGPTVGEAIAAHPGVDMVSFTGSTRAGVAVAIAAAPTVKRVTQELGGKSANIILDDADLEAAVSGGVRSCFLNSGQSCNAPTRMLVSRAQHDAGRRDRARAAAESMRVGDPIADGTMLGPVVSETQFDKIQRLIQAGIDEGARLVDRRPGPARRSQPRLLRPADGLRRRPQRHDDRARGDLRAGALHPALRRARTTRSASPTTRRLRPLGLRVVRATSSARAGSRRACAPATST